MKRLISEVESGNLSLSNSEYEYYVKMWIDIEDEVSRQEEEKNWNKQR